MPLEILHRAAPCRNVPVTFTLALMIETASKPRLPKFAAWPVGRERLARAVEGLPHLASATIRFSDYIVTRFISDPKHRGQPYPVLELEFARLRNPTVSGHFVCGRFPRTEHPESGRS